MAIRNLEEIKLSNLANNVNNIVRRDSTFVELMKMLLDVAIAFKKE